MDESTFDPDFDIPEDPIDSNSSVYETSISLDDELILVFKDQGLFIGTVVDIEDTENKITVSNEVNDFVKLTIDMYLQIVLETEDYKLLDIERVKALSPEEEQDTLDDFVVETLKQDIYPEIKFQTVEASMKDYQYTLSETRDILLSSILDSMETYNQAQLVIDLSNGFDELLSMKEQTEPNYLDKYESLPPWLRPISTNYKRVYKNVEETIIDSPFIYVDQFQEIESKQLALQSANDYFQKVGIERSTQDSPTQLVDQTQGTIQPYSGRYLMNRKEFGIDSRRAPFPMYYETKDSVSTQLVPSDTFGYDQIVLFPNKYFNLNVNLHLSNDRLPLSTKQLFMQTNPYQSLADAFTNSQTVMLDSTNLYSNKQTMIYKQRASGSMLSKLQDILPSIRDMLDTLSIPIYNYHDIELLLLQYDIRIHDMTVLDKTYANKLLKKRVNSTKRWKYSPKPKPQLSPTKPNPFLLIRLLKQIIFRETNIVQKNNYLRTFIDRYTKPEPNSNWLLDIYMEERCLCKHHCTACEITRDKDAYESLMTNWAGDTIDGVVYCRNCNEYLAPEDFSLLEGFEGDQPMQTKEVLPTDEKEDKLQLTSKQINDLKLIETLSINFGVNLSQEDQLLILNTYELMNEESFADYRYDKVRVMTESYPSLKRQLPKLPKNKRKELLSKIRSYIHDVNKLCLFSVCTLVCIQINIPGYKDTPDGYHLLDFDVPDFLDQFAQPESFPVESKGVDMLLSKLTLLSGRLKGSLWNHCKLFLKEYKNPDILKPKDQIKRVLRYLLSPYYPEITQKIKYYYQMDIQSETHYLKRTWKTYKPLPDNKLVESINRQLNTEETLKQNKGQLLMKNLVEYQLENSGNVISLKQVEPKYKEYGITVSDILVNQSFLRLYGYTIYLSGTHIDSNYLNQLIYRLIQTIEPKHKQQVLEIFQKGGWSLETQSFKTTTVNLPKLKRLLAQIIDYYKQFGSTDIEENDHQRFQNIQLPFLTTQPKRIYGLLSTDIFSQIDGDRVVDRFKQRFCYDINDTLRVNHQGLNCASLEIDVNLQLDECNRQIKQESFSDILLNIQTQTKLEPIYPYQPKPSKYSYLTRLISYTTPIDRLDILWTASLDVLEGNLQSNKLRDIITDIQIESEEQSKSLIEFVDTSDQLPEALQFMKSSKLVFGKNYQNWTYLFRPPQPGDANYDPTKPYSQLTLSEMSTLYDNLIQRISQIAHRRPLDRSVPTWWRLTDYRESSALNILDQTYLTIHSDMFLPGPQKQTFQSYYEKYRYFELLLPLLKPIDFTQFKGSSQPSLYTESRSFAVVESMFFDLFHQMQDFIESTMDPETQLHQTLSIEFESDPQYSLQDCYNTLSKFLIECFIDILEQMYDPAWIYKLDQLRLREQLSLQKEREKLQLTNQLDQMDANQRYVYVQKQAIGAVNWYQNASNENRLYMQSEEFKQKTLEERLEYFKQLESKGESVSNGDVPLPQFDVIVDNEEEGYYDQNDLDMEGEFEDRLDMNVEDEDIMGY